MTSKTYQYPESVMRVLRQREGFEPDDKSADDTLATTHPQQALREIAAWELGAPGWADEFRRWVESCGGKIVWEKEKE